MDCIECKTTNSDENLFCGKCGAEIGRSLAETVRKGFRDRRVIETEITESVAERLVKWGRWIAVSLAIIVGLFGFLLGKSYYDITKAVGRGETEISKVVTEGSKEISGAVSEAKKEVASTRTDTDEVGKGVRQLQGDIKKYQEVNQEMEKLQKQFHGHRDEDADLKNADSDLSG